MQTTLEPYASATVAKAFPMHATDHLHAYRIAPALVAPYALIEVCRCSLPAEAIYHFQVGYKKDTEES